MPRPYRLGRRAAPKAEVRERIVSAALAVYAERGFAGASNLSIAKAADVAPATVRNHFPEPGDLPKAVFDAMLAQLRPPTPDIFEGVDGLRDRVDRLAFELAAFYERSVPWWRVYEREPDLIRAWSGGVDKYHADTELVMKAALGDLSTDDRSLAVIASIIGPPTFFALRARGLSSDEVVALSLELAVPWLEQRLADLAGRHDL